MPALCRRRESAELLGQRPFALHTMPGGAPTSRSTSIPLAAIDNPGTICRAGFPVGPTAPCPLACYHRLRLVRLVGVSAETGLIQGAERQDRCLHGDPARVERVARSHGYLTHRAGEQPLTQTTGIPKIGTIRCQVSLACAARYSSTASGERISDATIMAAPTRPALSPRVALTSCSECVADGSDRW